MAVKASAVRLLGIAPTGQTMVRVKFAINLLTQMLPSHVIVDRLMDKFGIRHGMARKALMMAREEIALTPPVDLEERRHQMRAAFGIAYVECMAKGSHGAAVRALRELALLDGLYPEHALRGAFGKSADESAQDVASTEPTRVRERMAELLAKHADAIAQLRKPGEN